MYVICRNTPKEMIPDWQLQYTSQEQAEGMLADLAEQGDDISELVILEDSELRFEETEQENPNIENRYLR